MTGITKRIGNFDFQLGKAPPQNIEIEKAVLGAILIESNVLHEIIHDLFDEMFYKDSHKEICHAIIDLYNDASNVDLLTVTQKLREKGKLKFIGGAFYITDLTSNIHSAAHIQTHILKIKESWLKRKIIEVSQNNIGKAYEDKSDAFESIDNMMSELMGISERLIGVDDPEINRATYDALVNLQKARKEKRTGGLPSGFVDIDRACGGWVEGHLIVMAARPGMGKTALLLAFAKYVAYKEPVLAFSLEMTKEEFIYRLISSEARVDYEKFRKAKDLTDEEMVRIETASGVVADLNLHIYEKGDISLQELRSRAIMHKKKHGLKLLLIDYLQLMEMPKADTKNNSIEILTKKLKALAKELNVPIILLSQLSRKVEDRGGDKRPQLADLRDSGAIEQDADSVMFIYRAEYYDMAPTDQNGQQMQEGTTEIIWAKNRHGRVGRVYLIFKGEYISFYDYSNLDTGEVIEQKF